MTRPRSRIDRLLVLLAASSACLAQNPAFDPTGSGSRGSNLDGQSRPSHSFIRFDIPAELAGLTVASATLRVQVADGLGDLANGPQSGELVLTGPFDVDSLNAAAPPSLQPLAGDMGWVDIGQWVTWAVPLDLVVPGQPLFLGLLPTANDGVFYRGAATRPGAPVLDLSML